MGNLVKIAVFLLLVLLTYSCASFVKNEDIKHLKMLEEDVYILKDDAGEGHRFLKKGERVKIYIVNGDDSIKVYAFPSNIKFLKAERTLILYILEDEFEGKKFDRNFLEQKLFEVLEKK